MGGPMGRLVKRLEWVTYTIMAMSKLALTEDEPYKTHQLLSNKLEKGD
jgi:hypothetical protein